MKSLKYYIITVLLCSARLSYGQAGYLVAKDSRIAKFEDCLINFLIIHKQFDINRHPFKTEDYAGEIYVRKSLELYGDSTENILLAQFGSLGDHTQMYWALLSSNHFFFFPELGDIAFKRFAKQFNHRSVETVRKFIKVSQTDLIRRNKRNTSPIVTDE